MQRSSKLAGACVVVAMTLQLAFAGPPKAIEYVNPVAYRITQTIEVTNHDVSPLASLELNLPIPQEFREQRVQGVRIVGDDPFRLVDREGLGLAVRSFCVANAVPRPGESKSLSVSYKLICKEIRTDAEVLADREYRYDTSSAEYKLYTRAEELIEADDPEIKAVADGIRSGTTHPYWFARKAYDYVIDHTEYASPSPGMGARRCLKEGKADCGWYAALFVALCRAGGIPARPVAGCWATGDNNWHCWAEFLLPGVGWVPADPTVGDTQPDKREFYFGNLDNNRVALIKAYNLSFDTDRGHATLGFMQVGCWHWYRAFGGTGEKISVRFHEVGERAR
ncbi:MAG: transglutaminase domain-containing protein [Phycisphaerales bacterium]|nr:transglutaminase domain-containing protein [Phycisphaerales bacterium]